MPRRRPFRRPVAVSVAPLASSNRNPSASFVDASSRLARAAEPVSRSVLHGYGIESLERRMMLTVLGGPGDSGQAEFFNLSGGQIRIAWHDMTFEVIDATVGTATSMGVEVNPMPLGPTAPTIVPNIYALDILQSNLNSWISIAAVPSFTATGSRDMIPFGSGPTINVVDTGLPTSTTLIAAPIGNNVGSVLLGAVSTATNVTGEPILSIANTMTASGPFNPGGDIEPGVYVSPVAVNEFNVPITGASGLDIPNDIGHFFFGGVITGNVVIPAPTAGTVPPAPASQGGNIGVFYAGAILTGDADGYGAEITRQTAVNDKTIDPANFTVGGDVRDLITAGAIGGGRGAATRADESQYLTGFKLVVAGTVGEINSRSGGFYGSLDVEHSPSIYGLPNNLFEEHELEAQDQFNTPDPGAYFQGESPFVNYPLLASDVFDNNVTPTSVTTEGDGQYLGSILETQPDTGLPVTDANGNDIYYSNVDGILEGDAPHAETTDNYEVALLAGQTIQPQLTLTASGQFQALILSLVDPDGRVVAKAEVASTPSQLLGAKTTPFQYTADRPGIYTFEITQLVEDSVTTDVPYTLTVFGVGNQGLAALVAGGGDIIDDGDYEAFEVDHGDVGAFIAPEAFSIASDAAEAGTDISAFYVPAGSLRVMKAGELGVSDTGAAGGGVPVGPFGANAQFGSEPILGVPAGVVGLLETINPGGVLTALTPFDSQNAANVLSQAFVVPTQPIGGDVQMIDGAGTVFLDLATNQGIGDLLAGNMATGTASFIEVNADNGGNDGIIDLIDVQGDLGTIATGGPAIVTNTGGYVRYMVVGGAIYQDRFFGKSFSSVLTGTPGAAMTYTEDTGANLTFTPQGVTTTTTNTVTTTDPTTNTTTTSAASSSSTGPQIALTIYGIRDKGGGVIVDATSTNGALTVTASGGNGSPSQDVADVSEINFAGNSINTIVVGASVNALGQTILNANNEPPLTVSAGTPTQTLGTTTTSSTVTLTGGDTQTTSTTTTVSGNDTTSSLTISGATAVDVLNVNVQGTGRVDSIANNTPGGEIDNLTDISSTASITNLTSDGTIGLVHSHTAAVVTTTTGNTTTALFSSANLFPWLLQSTGIYVTGNVLNIRATGGVGNINVTGEIGSIVANSGGRSQSGTFSGINAPILAGASGVAPAALAVGANNITYGSTGNILSVSIGQGILPSGTGTDFSRAGLYAEGDIGVVTNNGRAQADIRGSIDVGDKLDQLTLGNASIIGAIVGSVFPFAGVQSGAALTIVGIGVGQIPITYEVGRITLTGRGGIIGSDIIAYEANRISVSPQGFGIIESIFETSAGGAFNQVIAGGYGIRDSSFIGGGSFNVISATGNGSQLPATAFGTDLRQSETTSFDVYSGEALTAANDLDAALGTSAGVAVIPASTDTGVLEDDDIVAIGTVGSISAQTVRTALPVNSLNELEPQANIPRPGQTFPMEISVAGALNSFNVRGTIDGLQITTGTLGTFHENGGVSRLGISVAGTIQNLVITGNFGQLITDPGTGATIPDSYIQATGPAGTIKNLTIDGNQNGSVTANVAIQNMTVLGNVVGSISALGQTTGKTLGTLRIGGSLKDGSLTIDGPAGSIIANGGLGDSTGTLTVNGSLQELEVGAARARGSTLASAVHVMGTLGKLIVNGSVTGFLVVDGDLTSLRVTGDGSSPNVIAAPITVGGRLYTANVADGNIAADITANGFIRNFTVTDGDVLATSTISSQLDAIQNFRITGGTGFGLFGDLSAVNGSDGNVDISGNLGDGTDSASIIEGSGKRFRIRGSILSAASIKLSGALASLEVDGNIAAGATVTAHPLTKLTVRGTNAGTVTAT